MPALLADALPDAFGNALVNAWMAEQGISADRITPLDRLAYAADRAMGALEFRPQARDAASTPPTAVQLADLVVAARRTVDGELASDETAYEALQQLIHVGTSAARHHLLSLCAMAHLDFNLTVTHSYDQYLHTVTALDLGHDALQQAYRRMVFNVTAVNRDDHTKNFAFLRRATGGWELAPAYDVTHAYHPDSRWTSRHLMSINGSFDGVTLSDLYAVGERHAVPGYKACVREVTTAVDEWPRFGRDAEVPDDVIEAIASDIRRFRPT